jgi:hypothetical protein
LEKVCIIFWYLIPTPVILLQSLHCSSQHFGDNGFADSGSSDTYWWWCGNCRPKFWLPLVFIRKLNLGSFLKLLIMSINQTSILSSILSSESGMGHREMQTPL